MELLVDPACPASLFPCVSSPGELAFSLERRDPSQQTGTAGEIWIFFRGIFAHDLGLDLPLSSVILRRDQFFEPGSPHLKREVVTFAV